MTGLSDNIMTKNINGVKNVDNISKEVITDIPDCFHRDYRSVIYA
jgi:hypothetical protein